MRFLLVVTEADITLLQKHLPAKDLGFEIRLDTFRQKPDFKGMRAATEHPLLATFRSKEHCGQGETSARASIGWGWREEALAAGFDAVDVELDEPGLPEKLATIGKGGAQSVLSHHEKEPGKDLLAAIEQGKGLRPDVLKIIGTGSGLQDFWIQKQAYRDAGSQRLVFFFMGQEFQATRLLSLTYGAPFTFAMPDHQVQVAPGVPPLGFLQEVFGAHAPQRVENLFAVLGSPIGHSQSPRFHNPMLRSKDAKSLFIALPAGLGELQKVIAFFPELRGMAVTKPLKEEAFSFANSFFGEGVAELGAVNTLIRRNKTWKGANTDYEAMRQLLSPYGEETRVRVLGFGGLGKAVVQASLELGHHVEICNRSSNRLGKVPVGAQVIDWAKRHRPGPEVLIQATSAGMAPYSDVSPMDEIPATVHTLVETIYNPIETRLMKLAHSQGIHTLDGSVLFKQQAKIQNAYFQTVI